MSHDAASRAKGASGAGLRALALLFVSAGVLHFLRPDGFIRIVPRFLPAPRALVFASGACEVIFGLGLLLQRTRAAAGLGLVALLVAVFPANIQMLVDARAAGSAPVWQLALWLRLPLQGLLALWVFRAAIDRRR
ncbi:MAG: DoxX family protein [Myxococcales bacterium]